MIFVLPFSRSDLFLRRGIRDAVRDHRLDPSSVTLKLLGVLKHSLGGSIVARMTGVGS